MKVTIKVNKVVKITKISKRLAYHSENRGNKISSGDVNDFLSIARPNPIRRPNSYPAYPPVIPIIAFPSPANLTVIKASGKAFPTAIIVKAKYVAESLLNTPIMLSRSINNPDT